MPARSITPRQLAGHLGGIRHYNQVENSTLSPNYPRRYATATEALAVFINDSLVARPGTQYVYSSFGFNLLGAVLEGATHQRFLSYVQDAVLTPLMMYGTVADHTDSIVANRSRGYWRRSDSSAIVNFPPGVVNYKWPSGGFLSTASDLVHFALAHARPGFLSDSTRALMFTPQRLSNGTTTRVGIGWRIAVDGSGRTLVHHGGAGSGTRAFLLLYPGERVAVAMLANILAPFAEDEAQQFACFFITH
jgi:CubicO group peptidase (beta-lactamase class C family)